MLISQGYQHFFDVHQKNYGFLLLTIMELVMMAWSGKVQVCQLVYAYLLLSSFIYEELESDELDDHVAVKLDF
jgi:hypothetical protein